jgi:hypothetical protein
MRVALVTTTLLFVGGVSASASAVEVSREAVIDAAPGRVWQVMGAFCSILRVAPGHRPLRGADRRRGRRTGGSPTQDGGVLLEKLLEHDNDGMAYSYSIVESPLPVQDYRSTISVADEGGKARLIWRSSFAPKGASRPTRRR